MSEFLIITGLSGAGRSTAADTFEDGGWFVIDNMPPALIGKVAELVSRPGYGTPAIAPAAQARRSARRPGRSAGAGADAAGPPSGSGPPGAPAPPTPTAPGPPGLTADSGMPAPAPSPEPAPAPSPEPAPAPSPAPLLEPAAAPDSERIALVVGRGGQEYVDDLTHEIDALRQAGHGVRILFLDAADDVLVRRFEGTRRRHPMPAESVHEGIKQERRLLDPIKSRADVVIDTSELNVHQLRGRLIDLFERDDPTVGMQTTVVSFGYKHGIPLDVDLVFDCRFLPNPHWVDELRPMTGLDEPVQRYVLDQPESGEFLDKLDDLLGLLLPAYVKEGKAYLTIAIGCTGGHHRSVVIAEQVAGLVEKRGFKPTLLHRDVQR